MPENRPASALHLSRPLLPSPTDRPTDDEDIDAQPVLNAPPGTPGSSPGRRGIRRNYGLLTAVLFGLYLAIAIGLTVFRGVNFIEPDRWAIFLLIGAVLLGQWKAFIRDFLPFVFLLFGFEFLRGLVGDRITAEGFTRTHHPGIHLEALMAADRWLFGGIQPTTWLQDHLYRAGVVHWYDVLAVLMYGLHFVTPLAFAFALWVRRKVQYWHFTVTLVAMSYLGFLGYLIYPAAPPWLAHQWGYLPHLADPFQQAFQAIAPHRYDNFDTMTLWTLRSPNPVAAMPSLHAAYPWLMMLFAVRFFGRWGWLFMIYNVALWFSVVYLGHHWVIDLLAGIALALVCYAVSALLWPRVFGRQAAQTPAAADPGWRRKLALRAR